MTWIWYMLLMSFAPMAILILLIVGFLLFAAGTASADGVAAAAEGKGTLTCWHCEQETTAGLKHCRHCGGELQ